MRAAAFLETAGTFQLGRPAAIRSILERPELLRPSGD